MAGPLQVTSPALCSAPLTMRSTLTTCASTSHGRLVTAPAALTPAHRPSGEALSCPRPGKGPSPWVRGAGVPRLLYVLSKEVGCPRAPHCCGWSRRRQLSLGEAVERPQHEAQAILSTLRAHTVPRLSRLVAGGLGRYLRPRLSESSGHLAWQMLRSGPGIGGVCIAFAPAQRTSYLHQPRARRPAGAQPACGNRRSAVHGSLQGCCSPSAITALAAPGLAGWRWAWLCMCCGHCPDVLVPQGQAGPLQVTPHVGEHGPSGRCLQLSSNPGVCLGVTGDLVRKRRGDAGEDRNAGREAARLRVVGPQCVAVGSGEQGLGLGLCAELFVPQPHRPRYSEDGPGWGRGPKFTPA